MKKKVIILTFFFLLGAAGYGYCDIVLNKAKIKLSVTPGQTISGSITLRNTADWNIALTGYMEDFVYVLPYDGGKKFLPVGGTDYSCSEWITFSPQQFTIEAKKKREVNYSITVPQDAHGGYYGVLFFEKSPEGAKAAGGLQIITRIGCLFFLETNDKIKKATVSEVTAAGDALELKIVNEGNMIIVADGIYYTMDQEGMVVDRGELQKLFLPPTKKHSFTMPLTGIGPGAYTTIVTFDLEDEDIMVKEIDFLKNTDGTIQIRTVRD